MSKAMDAMWADAKSKAVLLAIRTVTSSALNCKMMSKQQVVQLLRDEANELASTPETEPEAK